MSTEEKNITQNVNPQKWVDEHADYLYSFAYYRVNNKELAEDLVQDTFTAALKSLHNFQGKSSERTWLVTILRNKVIDYYRKKSTKNEVNVVDGEVYDYFFDNEGKKDSWKQESRPQNWSNFTENVIEQNEFRGVFNKCLEKLPEKYSIIFSLKNIEGVSSEEICKDLNLSKSNYWVIMHRAKLMLRDCLETNWFTN